LEKKEKRERIIMSWREYGLINVEVNGIVMQIVGLGALGLSLLYRIPQIYEIYKTESAEDISTWMLIIQNLSYILYIIYGVFVHDWIYITSSVLSFVQNLIIYFMKVYYRHKHQIQEGF
jgi:uncharacterized protein with PQ loop repeat